MKNIFKLWRLIAVIAIIGFTVVACDGGGTSSSMKWTAIPAGDGGSTFIYRITSIAYGDGRFVAGGDGGRMAYSLWE